MRLVKESREKGRVLKLIQERHLVLEQILN